VLEERNQRRRRTHDLHGRQVHVVHVVGIGERELAPVPHEERVAGELAVGADRLVGLGDPGAILHVGGDELDIVLGRHPVLDPPVRCFQEPELIDPGIGGQTRDEPDVRTFRGLDGAHPPVVGVVDVANLEPGAVAGEAARAQGREAPLVGQLGEGVGLVHELAELAGPEERLHHRADGPRVDQVVGSDVLGVLQTHPLADDAGHAGQPDVELVGQELAHRPDAAIAEMVDVVRGDVRMTHPQQQQVHDDRHEVLGGQRGQLVRGGLQTQPPHAIGPAQEVDVVQLLVQLEPAHLGEVVPLGVEEQPAQDLPGGLRAGRLAGAQQGVDPGEGVFLSRGRVALQGVAHDVGFFLHGDVEEFDLGHARLGELLDLLDRDLLVGLEEDLAGLGVHDVLGHHPAFQSLVLLAPAGADLHRLHLVEQLQNGLFGGVAQRLEQHGHRQLPLAIDVDVHDVVHVEGELHPGAPVGDDPGGEQALAVGMNGVVEEHAGRAVQLRDDDPLRAVDDKGPGVGQQRQFAEVDLLLDDLLVPLLALDVLADPEAERGLHGRGEGEIPLLALVHRVLGLADGVGDELQGKEPPRVADGKDGAEDLLQTHVPPFLRRDLELQKVFKRPKLDVQQMGQIHDPLGVQLGKAHTVVAVIAVVQGHHPRSR
jgi:hypothetical protein